MFTLGGTTLRSARATIVGYNLHGMVTGRVPIELKWCDFTLQTYSLGGSHRRGQWLLVYTQITGGPTASTAIAASPAA
jgi:hypothetical protein